MDFSALSGFARADRPAIAVTIEAATGRPTTGRKTTMATIGEFTQKQDGNFEGTIKTLTINAKVSIVTNPEAGERGPHYRLFAGKQEVGAAWKKTAQGSGREYLSVKIDDPSFPAPVYANLTEQDGKHLLIWSRN